MKVWLMGARPRTLPAAVAPVLVASALAGGDFNPTQALLALIVSLALQIGVNYANDYSDGVRGTDADRVGPTRITAAGLATPASVKRAAFLSFAIAAVAGFILAATTSWLLILVGLIAIIAAWGYTGGSRPYGYLGLGELFVFIFFGVVATVGSYYVQVEVITLDTLLVSFSMGAFSCALLAINNIRDRALDQIAGKRTLAVRLGDRNSRLFFVLLLSVGYLPALALREPSLLLTLLSLPTAISLAKGVLGQAEGRDLIPLLGKTAQLQLQFSALLAIALVLV
jgi:1,4-dihydroxy-2-naphthoate octaprenyltransferase